MPVDGDAWRIRLRVRTSDEGAAKGFAPRLPGLTSRTDRRWRSGRVPAGSTSDVGGVRVPRGADRWQFVTSVTTDGGGSSSSGLSAAAVIRC